MAKSNMVAGLDIGSSNIKLLLVERKKNEKNFNVLFKGEEPSLGVRRGVVIDVDRVSRTIQILIDKARIDAGEKIDAVFVNIGGSHLICNSSQGMVAVSRADRNISREDIDRVLAEASKAVPLSLNQEIIETFTKEFIVDGLTGIKEAEGLEGNRLEAEIFVLSSFLPYKKNLTQAVLNADVQVLDIFPSGIACSTAVLSQRQKELGVAVLDIGAGTSDLAVFQEGDLIHLSVLPIGSANITSDIAIGFKIDVDIAEAIKVKQGSCFFSGKDKKEKIEIDNQEILTFSQKSLAKIIEARLSEIFNETQKELKKISKQNFLPAGLVLTGGGAKMPKIADLAKKELKMPCRIGKTIDAWDMEQEDPAYAVACGLVVKGFDSEEFQSRKRKHFFSGNLSGGVKKVFKNFLP